ncbi:hypothetical protein [Brevundimonas nasdae]|uniref:Uncharacterized protein n=1 Tax=Brevundimonas nasdae TaxID=172043 RepID=A0ACD4VPB6_9CAUL|nr:hypothetical protein [Brevundimonas nasdae]WOB79900.1 hypothetical protein PZA08_06920 [Brevundimonas nasdae]
MTITFGADDVAYFDEVHGRRFEALSPKRLEVEFRDGEAARPNDCHANAVRWAAQTPDAIPVHGWLIEAHDEFQLHIVAHSVVSDERGRLIDVTPMPIASPRFIPHHGTGDAFFGLLPRCNRVSWPVIDTLALRVDRDDETNGLAGVQG